MNRPIYRIYIGVLVSFLLLVVFTSRWSVLEAEELEQRNENRRPLIAEQQIPRGSIETVDGTLIAESVPEGGGKEPVFVRRYPQGPLFAHPLGYNFVEVGRTGIELSENDLLVGEENEFTSILDQLEGSPVAGADITLTIDAEAQRVATDAIEQAIAANSAGFAEAGGSVVAIEPSTGAVRAMVSVPSFDPGAARDAQTLAQLNQDPQSPVFNRATQATGYPPGSTMKVVTVAAGLDSGEIEPTTTLNADSPQDISGFPLENSGGESFGMIDATFALTNSVNTYWAQVGEQLGSETYIEYMERFGFNSDPELDYPDTQMAASGVEFEGGLANPGAPVDIGRVAIGQGSLTATPLQMAEVAATIANGGSLTRPTFIQEARDPDGRVIEELDGDQQEQVVSEETAAQVTEMMTNVTQEGTAAGLTVPGVTDFAGKTGTAEIDVEASVNQPWFIGFAPAQDPQIAIAATIERCTGCFGGEVAGPIAVEVMGSLLNSG